LIDFSGLDDRPLILAIAGPNGAGKTTFYFSHLEPIALAFIEADHLSRQLDLEPYEAARLANELRRQFFRELVSFVFETVFSDPVGDKLAFLKEAAESGYTVVLCFVGISGPEISEERVAMRVSQGGHDVPSEKLVARFPRTISNLEAAIRELPHVLIFDNEDLSRPFRLVAVFERGRVVTSKPPIPDWLDPLF
jgi:predicted ABC-type ATPase